jgi:DNA-binding Lrp family transcriptional regulator
MILFIIQFMATPEQLLLRLEELGGASARVLAEDLGLSQPTVSRLLKRVAAEVVVLRQGRQVRYRALDRHSAFAGGLPLYRVSPEGQLTGWGTLLPLTGGGTALRREGAPTREFPQLPWFIEELRPRGFLGRRFAQSISAELGLPGLEAWTPEHLLTALSQRGEDLPGDLLLGAGARDRFLQQLLAPPAPVTRADLERLAVASLSGGCGGPVRGESPRFTAATATRHLVVKFSPPLSKGRAAKRWADLLVCEHLALTKLREHGLTAAKTELVRAGDRLFLEVERVDRTPLGRRALVSGAGAAAQFVPGCEGWTALADGLLQRGHLSAEDASQLRLREAFAGLISHGERRLEDVAFFDGPTLALAPAEELGPWALRPTPEGTLPTAPPELPLPTPEQREVWVRAAALAEAFWNRVSARVELEAEVQAYAAASLAQLRRLHPVAARLGARPSAASKKPPVG